MAPIRIQYGRAEGGGRHGDGEPAQQDQRDDHQVEQQPDAPQPGGLSCPQLESLWEQAGGQPGAAVMAASIAMAESGGRQFATGAVGERGYWQIHPDHGPLSTYDPLGNARAAVTISGNGTGWTAWTTFTSGAYRGRC